MNLFLFEEISVSEKRLMSNKEIPYLYETFISTPIPLARNLVKEIEPFSYVDLSFKNAPELKLSKIEESGKWYCWDYTPHFNNGPIDFNRPLDNPDNLDALDKVWSKYGAPIKVKIPYPNGKELSLKNVVREKTNEIDWVRIVTDLEENELIDTRDRNGGDNRDDRVIVRVENDNTWNLPVDTLLFTTGVYGDNQVSDSAQMLLSLWKECVE